MPVFSLATALLLTSCGAPSERNAGTLALPESQSTQQASNGQSDNSNPSENTATIPPPVPNNGTPYQPQKMGEISNARLPEISGLAASRLHTDRFWAINDSGSSSELHLIDSRGRYIENLGTGVENRDWEDLAAFTWRGEHYLLVADIGDNLARHPQYTLHFFLEPQIDNALHAETYAPLASITFHYDDGPLDAEAIAVSETEEMIFIISKRKPSTVYQIPLSILNNPSASTQVARKVANFPAIEQSAADKLVGALAGVDLSSVTAFDIDERNNRAWILTYRGIYQAIRNPGENWASALSRDPKQMHLHTLSQAEALTTQQQTGEVWFTSEKLPAPLWRLSTP